MPNDYLVTQNKVTKNIMNWFKLAFGFDENPSVLYERDNEYLSVQYNGNDIPQEDENLIPHAKDACPTLTCKKSGEVFHCGFFSTPLLKELRQRNIKRLSRDTQNEQDIACCTNLSHPHEPTLKLSIEVGDVSAMHEKYPFSTIQVASQLNCLEFVSPTGDPENGVERYAMDHTQGPACCLCTAPAIVYRNYYHPYKYDDKIVFGQKKYFQWNNLNDIEKKIGNENGKYWKVRGGYTMSEKEKLASIPWDSHDFEELKGLLRIGVHADTQITSFGKWGMKKNEKDKGNRITHVLCSACAIGYNGIGAQPWTQLAKLILQACYEATLYVGLENYYRHPDKKFANKVPFESIFLTA